MCCHSSCQVAQPHRGRSDRYGDGSSKLLSIFQHGGRSSQNMRSMPVWNMIGHVYQVQSNCKSRSTWNVLSRLVLVSDRNRSFHLTWISYAVRSVILSATQGSGMTTVRSSNWSPSSATQMITTLVRSSQSANTTRRTTGFNYRSNLPLWSVLRREY